MNLTGRINPRWWLGLGLALTVAKLWLSRGQGVFALPYAAHDDALFILLAQHLINGDWLGPYHELTLAKGPAYPLFIAAVFLIGLPLFLAQHLFYAGACALVVQALRPAITAAGWRFVIYALLLWNPMTYDAPAMGRVLRQHLYGPLALLIFASLIALYLRRRDTSRQQLPWILTLGLSAGAFYLTREDTAWLVPGALLLVVAYLVGSWRISRAVAGRAVAGFALGGIVAALPVLLVSAQNQRHYGWFGTSEVRAAAFQDAYGAMLRVEAGPRLPFEPVTREARLAMAQVSPAFAEIQQQFDAGVAQGWAGAATFLTGRPAAEEQIGGGWLVWALREATARAGYHGNAAEALAFYRRLADELNEACDQGRLPAGPPRRGYLPPWSADLSAQWVQATREFTVFVLSFQNFSARPPPSVGSPEGLQGFRDLTRERLAPPEGELDVVGATRYLLNLRKVERLQAIGKALRPVLLGLSLIALGYLVLRLLQVALARTWSYPLTLALAAAGSVAASIIMHAVIEVSSFPVGTISSFAPVYPLLLLFIVAAGWDAAGAGGSWRRRNQVTPLPAWLKVTPAVILPVPPRLTTHWPWFAALGALLPFVIWRGEFRQLFWFGDDLFLIDQIANMGLWSWSLRVFSENFVPLFKILWGGSLQLFGGSYLAMLILLWLTHALNTVLLGAWMQRAGFPTLATALTLILFALTPANLETLGWSVQWSAVLATSFLLLGLLVWENAQAQAAKISWRTYAVLALCAGASACSFSRGVLTGPLLAMAVLLPGVAMRTWRDLAFRIPGTLACLLPALVVAGLIARFSSGNHQAMGEHAGEALTFGLSYFLFNPGHALLGGTSLHPVMLLSLAGAKLAIIGGALYISRDRVRALLLLLLAFDLGSAVLVGIGRHHTGFLGALSSRYQYGSLIATLPGLALLINAGLSTLPITRRARSWAGSLLLWGVMIYCLAGWPSALRPFTEWRGRDMRAIMAAPATRDHQATVPALDFMHVERAKALQRAYHLH